VLHRAKGLPFEPKSAAADKRGAAAAVLRRRAQHPEQQAALQAVMARVDATHVGAPPCAGCTQDDLARLRGLIYKARTLPPHSARGQRSRFTQHQEARGQTTEPPPRWRQELLCDGRPCDGGKGGSHSVLVGTFPYLHFASGHTYFAQSLQLRLRITPVAVHTTFQFGDTPEFTWGKRNRLRERQLWKVDPDEYYLAAGYAGAAKGGEEDGYRGYLQLTGELVDLRAPIFRTEASSSLKIEGSGAYSQRMQARRMDARALADGNPNKHLLLDALQRRLVHNAVALGRALRRKVIMPRMQCWCDRYWWLLDKCRFPGVKPETHPLPFHCPFDHVFDLEKWVHSDAPMRECGPLTGLPPASRPPEPLRRALPDQVFLPRQPARERRRPAGQRAPPRGRRAAGEPHGWAHADGRRGQQLRARRPRAEGRGA
jgi:hypothetical protein